MVDEPDQGKESGALWWTMLPEPAQVMAGEVREQIDALVAIAGANSERLARWMPVLQAAREVGADLMEVGRRVTAAEFDGEGLPDALIADLAEQTRAVFDAFPNVVDAYGDLDALDQKLEEMARRRNGEAIERYIEMVAGWLDQLMRRVIDGFFDDQKRRLSPDQIEAALERLDAVLAEVIDRWIVPATIDGGSSHGPAGDAPGTDSETDSQPTDSDESTTPE